MSQQTATRARVKRERSAAQSSRAAQIRGDEEQSVAGPDRKEDVNLQSPADRRVLRSHYRLLKHSIAEDKLELARCDSQKFEALVQRVEDLHLLVRRPREQIADAQALFDITDAFLHSVKDARRGGGISAADFVSTILQTFGEVSNVDEPKIDWRVLGLEASAVFNDAPGLCTMLGPMDSEPKKRKATAPRRRGRTDATETERPETVGDATGDEKADKNIRTMFNILRRCGENGVQLENLVLNRSSFAETVENIFFLSFLVKDGRAQISIEDGKHFVAYRYAPSADERSGRPDERGRQQDKVVNSQFVFRFDFKDWTLMKETVEDGKELMPKRHQPPPAAMTPIRKNSRNRGRETLTDFDENAVRLVDSTDDYDDNDDAIQRPGVRKRLG